MLKYLKNEKLSNHTTLRIGGPAKYFVVVKTLQDIKTALEYAQKRNLKIFILGAGSNLLASDSGFDGLVINIKGASGILLAGLLNYCAKSGLSGLEFLAGIPGSLGGAVYMNAGAYGKQIGDFISYVYAIDYNGRQYILNKRRCKFGYRKSVFQKKKLIITGAEFELQKGKPSSIKKSMKEIIAKRLKKQPYSLPSAGSVFKNPKGNYAASLIENAGLKGLRVGGAMVSPKHANFIVNYTGKAKSSDVEKLIKIIQQKIKKQFKRALKPEIKFLNE